MNKKLSCRRHTARVLLCVIEYFVTKQGDFSLAVPLAVSTQYANVTDTQPVRHHMTTKTTLMHNIARQKLAEVDIQSHCESQSFTETQTVQRNH